MRFVLLLCATCLTGAALGGEFPTNQPAGTQRMIERLAKINREVEPFLNPFATAPRIEFARREFAGARTFVERSQLGAQFGRELLAAGQNAEAARLFTQLLNEGRSGAVRLDQQSQSYLRMQLAVAFLRWGEQQNCRSNHNGDSCLLPLRGGGIHPFRAPSERARSILSEQLRFFPDDLPARWLLNLASMALGDYPGNVPQEFLIPAKIFDSDYPLPRFPDIAEEAGLRMDDLAGGTVVEDFDGDGFLDVLFSSWDWAGQLRYFRNMGNGQFVERTKEAGLVGLTGGLNMVQGDYNNDGFPDVFILRGAWFGEAGRHPNSLLRNNGNGTFTDVTEEAGLLSFHPTQTAVWFDYDSDGWLDLFIGNETSAGALVGNAVNIPGVHPCELYHNNHNGAFTECAAAAGLNIKAFVKGAVADDFNNDGRPDLYLSILGAANMLFRNDGPAQPENKAASSWRFVEIAAQAGVTEPLLSFPTWFFDYDNDGWPDIFVAGYSTNFSSATLAGIVSDMMGKLTSVEKARLFHNNRDGTFSDATAAAKLDHVLYGMGANFGDLDNDGYLDFLIGTGDPNLGNLVPNLMFRNAAGKFFQNVTTAGGFGNVQKGHGIAFADLNNDGQQDIVANLGGAYPGDNYRKSLYANPGNSNHWVTLKLEGVQSNRSAIGARIKIVVETGQGLRTIYKSVNSGGSFGASPLRQEIGLGSAKSIQSVEIRWAGSRSQVFRGLAMDRFYSVRESDPAPKQLTPRSFRWPTPGSALHQHEQK